MKNSEIQQLTTKELVERIEEEKANLTRLRMNHVISPLENPNVIPATKQNIARLKTELRKREISEAK